MSFPDPVPNFEERVRGSFARQRVMANFGVTMELVQPGRVTLRLPYAEEITQQHGYVHAGVITAVVDSACGYSGLTLMPEDAAVLTVEYKVNLLAPAAGEAFLARGSVVKAGRTLTVARGDVVVAPDPGAAVGTHPEPEKLVATMTATLMTVQGRGIID